MNIWTCRNWRCTANINLPILCSYNYHCDWHENCVDGKCTSSAFGERSREECISDWDCREGYRCSSKHPLTTHSYCEYNPWWQPSHCNKDRKCLRGEVCYNDRCTRKISLKRNGLYLCDGRGDECASYSQEGERTYCYNGVCIQRNNLNLLRCKKDEDCDDSSSCRMLRDNSVCVPNHLTTDGTCVVDSDCGPGRACLNATCADQNYLYQYAVCSFDGHCIDNKCIGGKCVGPMMKWCTSKEECDDYQYCSTLSRCYYPQRVMIPGEPLPCYSDMDCPKGRVCYHLGCVRPSNIQKDRGACHSDADCGSRELCFDGFCIDKSFIPDAIPGPNGTIKLIAPKVVPPKDGTVGLGLPRRHGQCTSDLSCQSGELCERDSDSDVKRKCKPQDMMDNCSTSIRKCDETQFVCHVGLCLWVVE